MDFRFEIVNLREFEAEPLLASPDWADNALALLAKGEREKALVTVISRLRGLQREDQNWAASTLLLLSGILGIEQTVNERLKEVGMINVMENKVLGPMLQQQFEQAERKGRSEGILEGRLNLLHFPHGLCNGWTPLPPKNCRFGRNGFSTARRWTIRCARSDFRF